MKWRKLISLGLTRPKVVLQARRQRSRRLWAQSRLRFPNRGRPSTGSFFIATFLSSNYLWPKFELILLKFGESIAGSWLSKVITSHFTMAASTALNEPSLMLVAMPKQGAPEASCKFKNSQPIGPSMSYFRHWNQKRLNGNRDLIHIPVEHGEKTYQLAKNPPFMLISIFAPLGTECWKLTSY